MNPIANCTDYWNRKVRKFTICDVKAAQGWAGACVLIIAKLFPQIMLLSVWWFVVLAIPFALRLVYTIWMKPDDSDQRDA